MSKLIELSLDNSGNLVLTNGGNARLGNLFVRNIFWEIAEGSNITSFKIEKKDPNDPYDPFQQRPNSNYGTKEHLTVRFLGPTGDWRYSILWKDSAGDHTYDPIISINPTFPLVHNSINLVTAVAVFLGIFLFFSKKKRKKKKKKSGPGSQ